MSIPRRLNVPVRYDGVNPLRDLGEFFLAQSANGLLDLIGSASL